MGHAIEVGAGLHVTQRGHVAGGPHRGEHGVNDAEIVDDGKRNQMAVQIQGG